jgi:hypothetical protein
MDNTMIACLIPACPGQEVKYLARSDHSLYAKIGYMARIQIEQGAGR